VTTSFVANDLKYTEAFYYIITLFLLYDELTVVVVSRHMSVCVSCLMSTQRRHNMCMHTSKDSKGAMCYDV